MNLPPAVPRPSREAGPPGGAAETSPLLPRPGPGAAPHGVEVTSVPGSSELLVTWQRGSGQLQEHVVDWARDGDPLGALNWTRLPAENLRALLPGEAPGHLGPRLSACVGD